MANEYSISQSSEKVNTKIQKWFKANIRGAGY